MQQVIRQTEEYKDSGLVCMNPRKHLEKVYDIRRNCASSEEPYSSFKGDQSLQTEALKQLLEYLHDEAIDELRHESAPLHHSAASTTLKTLEDL